MKLASLLGVYQPELFTTTGVWFDARGDSPEVATVFADSLIHAVGELSKPQTWNDAPIKTGLLNFDAHAS
jgi:hypothetical protein